MGLRISVSLAKCGQCGKRYSNPVTHVCVNPRGGGPRIQVKPRVAYDCPQCKKPVTNPLTHVCTVRTDWRKRVAAQKKREAAEKRANARAAAQQHDYHSCRDPECLRRACVAYREGFEAGDEDGYRRGVNDGYRAGYDAGFPDGIAACPLAHK